MLKKLTVLTGTAALVLTSFALAGAQEQIPGTSNTPGVQGPQKRGIGSRRKMGRRARRTAFRALRQLNLTDSQKQQAQSIVRANLESNKAVREELKQILQQRQQGAMLSEADQARARELRQQLHESRRNARAQLGGLLTGEQRTQLEEMRKQRRERRERFGRRGQNKPV
jgi:Spy/CpxP family protein refolding chaperone